MNQESWQRVQSMARLSTYLRSRGLVQKPFVDLAISCHDRAVLVLDIHKSVLESEFGFTQDQLQSLRPVMDLIAEECGHETDIPGRHIPPTKHSRKDFKSYGEFAHSLIPPGWSFTEFVSAAPSPTGYQIQRALEQFFRESQEQQKTVQAFILCRTYTPDPSRLWHTFADRTAASGLGHSGLDTVTDVNTIVDGKNVPIRKSSRGPPLKRIRELDKSMAQNISRFGQKVPWRFVSQLMAESQFRTQAKSFTGSWSSTGSALSSFHIWHDITFPSMPELPVSTAKIAGYASCLDNAGTLSQYVRHLRQAHRLLNLPAFNYIVPSVLRGASKGASIQDTTRSFLTRSTLTKVFDKLTPSFDSVDRDLEAVCMVGYYYQLRVHSELFIICRDSRGSTPLYTKVEVGSLKGRKTVSLILSKRKNRPYECTIIRSCWCPIGLVSSSGQCGPCILEKLAKQAVNDTDRLFSQSKSVLIKRLKSVAHSLGEKKVTWHGLRRGRTLDLLQLRDDRGRPVCTLSEVFESGQWKEDSRSVLSYLDSKSVDGEKLVLMQADQSESDAE